WADCDDARRARRWYRSPLKQRFRKGGTTQRWPRPSRRGRADDSSHLDAIAERVEVAILRAVRARGINSPAVIACQSPKNSAPTPHSKRRFSGSNIAEKSQSCLFLRLSRFSPLQVIGSTGIAAKPPRRRYLPRPKRRRRTRRYSTVMPTPLLLLLPICNWPGGKESNRRMGRGM